MVTRTLELDSDIDLRLRDMAEKRGQDVSAVVAEAVALLDSTVEFELPDVAEDRRRYDEYLRTGMAVSFEEFSAWVDSLDSPNELPRPIPRRIE